MSSVKTPCDRSHNRNHRFGSILSFYHASVGRWAPIPLRMIVGYGFAEHGFAKLLRGTDHFAAILHAIGLPMPNLLAWLTIVIELVGGFCISLGALVPIVSIPMAIVLLVAIFTVHLPYGFSSIKLLDVTPNGAQFGQPGYETDLLYLAGLVALVVGGSGPISIDSLFPPHDAATEARGGRERC
jgi:putative oxidoreductase